MQFLSVARRELRVAARKRSSFRMGMFTSLLALCVSGFSLWFVTLFGAQPISGEQLFFNVSWLSLLCACVAGPALTADCVNEESNNGTLGLLFLSNMHGISIFLGKLIGNGLLALYSIVSVVPVMALPVLLGGTDAASLAKTSLVLLLTLIVSLMIGMFASTVCRKPSRAAAVAFLFLALFLLGIPLAALVLRLDPVTNWSARLELLSPSYALSMASPSAAMLASNHFWHSLGVQMLIALSFFGLIMFFLPRAWKEGRKEEHYLYSIWRMLKYGSREARRRLRAHLLRINPILWLSSRERFGPMGFAIVLLGLAFAVSWTGQHGSLGPFNDNFQRPMVAWIAGIPLLYICFCFRLAAAASDRLHWIARPVRWS